MTSLNNVLRKLISDCTDYCCLCFEIFEDKVMFYNIQDKEVLDTECVDDIYEILFTVLGEQTINLLSSNMICEKCTQSAIDSYKFIEISKNNVQLISNHVDSLKNYVTNVVADNFKYKSLFLAIDRVNYTIKELYDENKSQKSEEVLCKMVQELNSSSPLIENIMPESCDMLERPAVSPKSRLKNKVINQQNVSSKNKKKYEDDFHSGLNLNLSNKNCDTNNHRCQECLKEYESRLKLKLHYLRVHAPKCFKCTKCPRSFGTPLLLNRHNQNSHCMAVCRYCGKTYNNAYSLQHHEKNHKVHLICKICGKAYKGKQAFDNHVQQKLCEKIRKANSQAKLSCSYCRKKYTQKSALNVHIRLEHENGEALICDWCGKKLSSQSKLKEHIIKHTKQKNFQCNICRGQFVTKASLLYHTRTHTGEKPYKCEYCDMRFLSASRRSEHVKRNHAGPDLECDICHNKFKGQTALTRHRKRHFNITSRLYHHQLNEQT